MLKQNDAFALLVIISFTFIYAIARIDFSIHPFEDAAILMRYVDNIAHGHGIVWNIGEKPLDGATDVLFMLLTALMNWIGLSIEFSVRAITVISHILTIYIIYFTIRTVHGSSLWTAVVTTSFFSIGTGIQYIASYFGTPFFALWTAICWLLANKIILQRPSSTKINLLFSVSCFFLALARPEGAILSLLIFGSILFSKGISGSKDIIPYFLFIFVGIGLAYFFWHWNYFNYPLPNPFYKKGGGSLYWNSLYASLVNTFRLTFPFIIPFILGCVILLFSQFKMKTLSRTVSPLKAKDFFSFIPIFGFTLIWILLSNEMNYFMRFQYATLVIVLMSWYPLSKKIFHQINIEDHLLKNAIGITLTLSLLIYQTSAFDKKAFVPNDGRFVIAKILSEYKNEGYTIATTEAGLLPFYSHWRSIDLWGLNDVWIAHNGIVTEEYLNKINPEVIMVLAYYSPLAEDFQPSPFTENTKVVKEFAEKNNYILAASFGITATSTHCYYVRNNFARSKEITERIRYAEYHWFDNGERCINFAKLAKEQ